MGSVPSWENKTDNEIAAALNRARENAQKEADQANARKKAAMKEARELIASTYEDAADIAFQGIEIGLDKDACLQIASALKLQGALIRGDVHET